MSGRRSDALRSRAAILDAAVETLNGDPGASMEAIAASASLTRQTVYAHFPSRDALLFAVVEHLTQISVSAMDNADDETAPASEVLLHMLDAARRAVERYPRLVEHLGRMPTSPQSERAQHTSIATRITQTIERGQSRRELDDSLPAAWLATVVIQLAHAASAEEAAGRLSRKAASRALRTTVLRVLAAPG